MEIKVSKDFQKNQLSKVELSLICIFLSAEKEEGWMRTKEIMNVRYPETKRLIFTSPVQSLPRYIKQLEKKGFVERQSVEVMDKNNRKSYPFEYRLKGNKVSKRLYHAFKLFKIVYPKEEKIIDLCYKKLQNKGYSLEKIEYTNSLKRFVKRIRLETNKSDKEILSDIKKIMNKY